MIDELASNLRKVYFIILLYTYNLINFSRQPHQLENYGIHHVKKILIHICNNIIYNNKHKLIYKFKFNNFKVNFTLKLFQKCDKYNNLFSYYLCNYA